MTDPATGLPLRDDFLASVDALIEELSAGGAGGAMFCVDVDRLRNVNSSAGRSAGDAVLAAVAEAMRASLEEGTILAREAGDAFAAFVPEMQPFFARVAGDELLKNAREAARKAEGLKAGQLASGSAGARLKAGHDVTVSVGLAYYSDDGHEAETLLSIARAACRKAYESGGGRAQEASLIGPPEGAELLFDRLPCPEFIGREKEILSFRNRVEACRAGAGYLFVRGEPGSGKTRALREFHRICRADGTPSAFSSCAPADALRPYSSLVRALAAHADENLGSRDEFVGGRSSAEMESLVPLFARYGFPVRADGSLPGGQSGAGPHALEARPAGAGPHALEARPAGAGPHALEARPAGAGPHALEARPAGAGGAEDLAPDARRRMVFQGLLGIAHDLARPEPLVFLFDNIQWLDEATLSLFRYVQRERPFGLLVAGVLNDSDLRDGTGALRPAAALAEMRGSMANLWETHLGRLTPEQAAGMTSAILSGRRESSDLDRAIYGVTGGNPGMHEGLLRLLAMRRHLSGSGRDWNVAISPASLPRTFDALTDTVIGGMPHDLAEAAAAVAAKGEAVGVQALGDAIGRSDAEATGFVDDLLRLKLFERARPGAYEIAPASTRFAERAVAHAGEDYVDVVHGAYADRAAGARQSGFASAGEEAYHRGLTSDGPAAASALDEARREAASVFRRPEGPGASGGAGGAPAESAPAVRQAHDGRAPSLSKGAPAAGVDGLHFGGPPAGVRVPAPRPKPNERRLSPASVSALGGFLGAFADALESASVMGLDLAQVPEVRNLLFAFEPLAQDVEVLTLSAREEALTVNGDAAGGGGSEAVAARMHETLRRHSVASLSLASGLTAGEAAILVEALAKDLPPPDWNMFLEKKGVERIGVAGGSFPRARPGRVDHGVDRTTRPGAGEAGAKGPPSSRPPKRHTVRKARFETHPDLSAEAKALKELEEKEERERLARASASAKATEDSARRSSEGAQEGAEATPATAATPAVGARAAAPPPGEPPAGAETDPTVELRYALDSLGPDHVRQVEGIPPGSDPIRVCEGDMAERVLGILDRLLDENDRATAAAVIWRVLANIEVEEGEERKMLASYLEELEPRIWRTRLAEAYRALEDTLARELRREKRVRAEGGASDDETLDLLTRSAARAMREFLRAGQYARLERVARILATMGPENRGDEKSLAAATRSLERLSRTDFFDMILSDLASDSPERSTGALEALKPIARAVTDRLVDIVRTADDYRLRTLAAEGLAAAGEAGGVAAIAQLGPTTPEDEYERIVSILDVLCLEPEVAEDEVVQAVNHASDKVRSAAVSVVYRLSTGSALGVLQRAINEGGSLGALRTVQAIGELRLVEAMPIVQKQLNDSQDASVVDAGCRAIGRMATDPDVPALRSVRLLASVLERLPDLPDKEEAERAALTTLWALGQYDIPERLDVIRAAARYPSLKVKSFAKKMLERSKDGADGGGDGRSG